MQSFISCLIINLISYSQSISKFFLLGGGFPGSTVEKDMPAVGLIPGLGRSPGVGNGNPLQYICLENSIDRGDWRATGHEIAKSLTGLSEWACTHACVLIRLMLLMCLLCSNDFFYSQIENLKLTAGGCLSLLDSSALPCKVLFSAIRMWKLLLRSQFWLLLLHWDFMSFRKTKAFNL